MLIVVIGLVALLPVLASLQYKWIGQLSDNEVDRLRNNLQSSAELFSQALNQEIFPAQFAFRVSFTGSLDDIARELSLNYQYWSSRVSRPDLIENIYWINYDEGLNLDIYHFDPAAGDLVEQAWPEELMGWQKYLIERNKLQIQQYNPQIAGTISTEELQELGAHLMATRPAIPIPISIDNELSAPELLANLNATSSGRAGHTLLTLDVSYLKENFLPELQEEFINPADEVDMMIVSNSQPEEVIYQTNAELTSDMFGQPDAEVGLARFRWNRFASASRIAFGYASIIDRDQLVADSLFGQVSRAWQPGIQDSFVVEETDLQSDFPLQAIIRLAQEEDYRGDLTAEDLLVALTSLSQDNPSETARASDTTSQPAQTVSTLTTPEHAWTLRLRHKQGSLEASVEANRRRNLALSFGILLMLGVASVIIYRFSQKAQELANRQMSFVTGVSHELRTPLSVIQSAADNLADGVINDPGRMQRYGQLIKKESHRLTDMVEQILELAGVLSHKKTFNPESVGVVEMIDEAIDTCSDAIIEKDFSVEKSLPSDLPLVQADAHALQGAICNLINNALKYSNGSHWIGITAALHQNGKGKEVQISVADKGIGIAPDELPHVFDDFFRGAAVRNAQIKGNGIGLSIVKKTMEAHNGRVSVISEPNAGTTFTLHLPVA